MNILITGANGFVGLQAASTLKRNGHTVKCAVRSSNNTVAGYDNYVIPNMSKDSNWDAALEGIDAVIHLVAKTHSADDSRNQLQAYREVNVEITKAICLAIKRSSVRHLIFLSSIKVHGETTDKHPFTESSPTTPEDAYGQTKLEAEQMIKELLQDSNVICTIVRPPLIWGKEYKGNLAAMQSAILKGYPIPFSGIRNARSIVKIDTITAFLAACLSQSEHAAGTFLLGEARPVSTPELFFMLGKSLGVKPRLFFVPPVALSVLFKVSGRKNLIKKLLRNLEVDASKSQVLLNSFEAQKR